MKTMLIVFAMLLFITCKKPGFNDLGGSSTISGIALLNDNYSNSNVYTPLNDLTIYLRSKADTFSYLYSVKTDKSGHFAFNGIDDAVEYRIDAVYDLNNIRYRGLIDLGPSHPARTSGRDSLLLRIDPALQNGIHLTVRDYLGGVIPFATVYVFNSPALFAADTAKGAAFQMTCDAYGVANKYTISQGDYYFRVRVNTGNGVLVDEAKTTLKATDINPVDLHVAPVPRPGFGNGLDFVVKNDQGNPAANASVYFYKNYETYIRDSANFKNSLFSLTADMNGRVGTYVINPGNYFAWGSKVLSTKDTLFSRAPYSITVGSSITTGPDMIVR